MVPEAGQRRTAEEAGQDRRHADRQGRRAAGARQDGGLADVVRDLRQHVGRHGETPAGDDLAACAGSAPISAAELFMAK